MFSQLFLVQNKYKSTLVGVPRTRTTFATHSSPSLRFCTQRDERLIASISSSTTTITNRNPAITQEMMKSAHKHFVLVLVVVVVKS